MNQVPVQYVRLPIVGIEVVENWLVSVIELPRATDPPPESPVPGLIVTEEFVRPALFNVPESEGCHVSVFPEPVIIVPTVRPLNEDVEEAIVTVAPV